MEVHLEPGLYVAAISGGVDSMVLLELLARRPGVELIVAHFDHGIRDDSDLDAKLVRERAVALGLRFELGEGRLGPRASEAVARAARYDFLRMLQQKYAAKAVITAHHQDDVVETAILNVLRGTGRRGIGALRSTATTIRPLLHLPKKSLYDYAKAHHVTWREDSTNTDTRYTRNNIRRRLALDTEQRTRVMQAIENLQQLNDDLDAELANYLLAEPDPAALDRQRFKQLPVEVAREVMAYWLREQGRGGYDAKTIIRLAHAGQTYATGKRADVFDGFTLEVSRNSLALIRSHR